MNEKETLRQQAEAKLALSMDSLRELSPAAVQQALHELRVHQIELEMQNEELRQTQAELAAARERYFDLYDLAPVGYCTLSEQGTVQEANLTAAELLGVSRDALVNRKLSEFISKASQDAYYLFHKRLLAADEPQQCEFQMEKKNGETFWARAEALASKDARGNPAYRIVLIDITQPKGDAQKLHAQLDELKRWYAVMLDRENRIMELKREVNELCRRMGEKIRYSSQEPGPVDAAAPEPDGRL